MKREIAVLALIVLAGCASAAQNYMLDGAYGSLAYKGSVSRQDSGVNFIYTVNQLDLTFDQKADVNATARITTPVLRFLTTIRARGDKPTVVTFESSVPTQIHLDAEHHSATVRSIKFVVPKSVVASSDYAGLDVTDGGLLWPLQEDLRN